MVGIGSTATNEASNSQWGQGEWMNYFQSTTQRWGMYGNNGTLGSAQNQNLPVTISGTAVIKLIMEDNGEAGNNLLVYELPSANPADWNDTSNLLLSSVSISTADEPNIMPFCIPQNGGLLRFVAFRVD